MRQRQTAQAVKPARGVGYALFKHSLTPGPSQLLDSEVLEGPQHGAAGSSSNKAALPPGELAKTPEPPTLRR